MNSEQMKYYIVELEDGSIKRMTQEEFDQYLLDFANGEE